MGLFILRMVLLAATGISGYFLAQQMIPFRHPGPSEWRWG